MCQLNGSRRYLRAPITQHTFSHHGERVVQFWHLHTDHSQRPRFTCENQGVCWSCCDASPRTRLESVLYTRSATLKTSGESENISKSEFKQVRLQRLVGLLRACTEGRESWWENTSATMKSAISKINNWIGICRWASHTHTHMRSRPHSFLTILSPTSELCPHPAIVLVCVCLKTFDDRFRLPLCLSVYSFVPVQSLLFSLDGAHRWIKACCLVLFWAI